MVYGILLKHWIFVNERRNHIAIWNWIQRFGLCNIYKKRKIVLTFMIDETVIQIGSQHFWLWLAIEPIHNSVFGIHISEKRNACYKYSLDP